MSQQITKIKSRIKTVSSALKVTSAMKLVSTVKLNRYKNKMLSNRNYSKKIKSIAEEVFKWVKQDNRYFKSNKDINKNLYVVFSSTLGLCGAYNTNLFKLADAKIGKDDDLLVIGKKGITHYEHNEQKVILDFSTYSPTKGEKSINKLMDYLINAFLNKEYKEIHLIYTSYRNSLAFIPKDYILLPLKKIKVNDDDLSYPPILEPSKEILMNTLIPLYLRSTLYGKLLESEVCEQAARCNAMESATDNANEILDALNIEFNKARQAAITQEITEIVGAAEAL